MINYTEKGHGLHKAIAAAGHRLTQRDGLWTSNNDAAVQSIIDAYDPLPDRKAEKITAIKNEGLRRVAEIFPAIDTIDEIAFFAEFWLSIKPTARGPTVSFQKVINIYSAATAAIGSVKSATTQTAVNAVIVAWPA